MKKLILALMLSASCFTFASEDVQLTEDEQIIINQLSDLLRYTEMCYATSQAVGHADNEVCMTHFDEFHYFLNHHPDIRVSIEDFSDGALDIVEVKMDALETVRRQLLEVDGYKEMYREFKELRSAMMKLLKQ